MSLKPSPGDGRHADGKPVASCRQGRGESGPEADPQSAQLDLCRHFCYNAGLGVYYDRLKILLIVIT